MRSFQAFPADLLAPYVDRLWGWESAGDVPVALPTLLPGTGAELYFHYRTPFKHPGGICDAAHLFCVRGKPVDLLPASDIGFIAVRFRAGMLHRFIDFPGGELLDRMPSAEDLWGGAGKALASRVASAETHDERLRLIQSFLAGRLCRRAPDAIVEHATGLLYEECADIAIDRLAARVGLGRRQLERRFRALTGQTPVELRLLSRFQKTVRTLMLDADAMCVDAALAHGYYDQAHFIRDFHELASDSPQRYLKAARLKTHFYNPSRRTCATMAAPVQL